MKKINITWLDAVLLGVLTCISTSTIAAPLDILTFKKSQLNQKEQNQICMQIKNFCQHDHELRSLKASDQTLWVLSQHDIAQFNVSASELKLLKQWKFNLTDQSQSMSNTQYIFPKLFPMDKNRYAVAVIDSFSEMYSGGGAKIERADFYALQDSGKPQQFIENYPFSFSRMIRACFSEEDYAQSKDNCHDLDDLTLDIRPIKPMLWQFRYRYQRSVSPVSDSGEKSFQGSRNLNIHLNQAPEQPNIPVAWDYTGME